MEGTGRITGIVQLGANLSLLAAITACLALWGGVSLLLTHPTHPHVSVSRTEDAALPQPVALWEGVSNERRSLADLLLFWLPLGLGAIACTAGAATLACGRQGPEAHRRALIALVLSAIPGCLCTLWYVAFSASPLLRK